MKQRLLLCAVTTALVAVLAMGPLAQATHEPANKTSAAGSETEIVGANNDVLLMSERVKTSKPEDLILQVTAECSIVTDITTTGTDMQEARGQVRVYVTIDGAPVPVSAEDTDNGRVVFCDRLERRETSLGSDDQSDTIRTFQNTRNANGFNWMALNVGSGVHTIEVRAEFQTNQTSSADAEAVVGNRTLIVEPTKAANDEAVTAIQ